MQAWGKKEVARHKGDVLLLGPPLMLCLSLCFPVMRWTRMFSSQAVFFHCEASASPQAHSSGARNSADYKKNALKTWGKTKPPLELFLSNVLSQQQQLQQQNWLRERGNKKKRREGGPRARSLNAFKWKVRFCNLACFRPASWSVNGQVCFHFAIEAKASRFLTDIGRWWSSL